METIGATPDISVRMVAMLKQAERTELEDITMGDDARALSLFDKMALRTFFNQADRIVALPLPGGPSTAAAP